MSTDGPNYQNESRPLQVTFIPTGDVVAVGSEPGAAAIKVPVARVPLDELMELTERDFYARQRANAASARPAPSNADKPADKPIVAEQNSKPKLSPITPPAINVAALPDDYGVLKQMIEELMRALRQERRDRQGLEKRLDALLRKLPRSGPNNPDQPLLFPDDDGVPLVVPPPAPVEEEKKSKRGKCKPHGRRKPKAELRREEKFYKLTLAERLCPECGQDRQPIGFESASQYDYKPAEVFVVEHLQTKYACKCCEGHVTLAPKPPQLIPKGAAGPGLLAQIIVDKHLDHIPLNRSEQRYVRMGAPLPRSTMCDWMASCAGALTPLWELLKGHVLQSKVLHTDDTTVPLRDEGRGDHRTARLWDYIGDHEHPGVVFDFTLSRARDGPANFLEGFKGFLQADAYGGYDGIYIGSRGAIIEVGCWAHARNKFSDAETSDPERMLVAKAFVRKLYDVEDEAKKMSSAERLKLRQEKSVPLLASFRQWLSQQRAQVLPKSSMAAAINYVFNQWEALTRYTTDGDLHIDNNISERTLKLIGMGRINWLFIGSEKGGRTAAVLYSFTATCKHLSINAFEYLRDVFERLPTHPNDRLAELLPHAWQAARIATAAAKENAASEQSAASK